MENKTKPLAPESQQWFKLGVQHLLGGRWGDAESAYRRILADGADNPGVQHNFGLALKGQQKYREAIATFRTALALKPDFAEAYNSLGDTLRETKQLEKALEAFKQALALRPDYPEANNNLGITLCELGRREEAIEVFRRTVSLQPGFPEAWKNLGSALQELERLEDAIPAFERALALRPDFPDTWNRLGKALQEMKRKPQAMEAFRRAVALQPGSADGWNNLGNALHEANRHEEAVEAYHRSLALDSGSPDNWINLGMVLRDMYRADEAIEASRRALGIKRDFAPAWNLLTGVWNDIGRLDQVMDCFDQAIAVRPEDPLLHGSRICTLHYHPDYDDAAIHQAARQWNDRFARPLAAEIPVHDHDPSPERRLRIGYVSPDFRRHCAALFLTPLLSHHDHRGFEIFCYSGAATSDGVTAKLRRHADGWLDIFKMTDQAVAQQIQQDKIDILVDLALYTAGSRLLVFARKPAPVQVTWLGYPGTTGLDTIDYRLTDSCLDPADSQQAGPVEVGTKEDYYSECSVRLPDGFWCYDPRGMEEQENVEMPVPGPLPALATGHVTFGCLNNFCKVTDRTLDLWAKVLAAMPNAHMLMVAPPGPPRERVLQKLRVSQRERVEFVPFQPWRQYLETYHRIDVCLDTLPFNGGTSGLDALWMGAPLVTRVGQTVVGRAGSSHLHNLGLAELVARSDEQFVKLAVELAGDLDRLGRLRSTLRERMERSPLMEGSRFARHIEAAYRQMWRAWCAKHS